MMVVSILIPAYNTGAFIGKCLDSVVNQTYQKLQIVIIDDGSIDNTPDICNLYSEKDNRVEFYTQENQGVAATRNNLLQKVKGDYVLFVDADDWIESDMVEYLVSTAVKYYSQITMCDRVFNETMPFIVHPTESVLNKEEAIKDFLYHEYFVGSLCNKLIKASIIGNTLFDPRISYGEDALFVWNILQNVDTVAVSDKQLYHYRMNQESISHQKFGEKKLTGHLTWKLISDDVSHKWPQYLDIAFGTFALQDMYLLRSASQGCYPKNEKISELQDIVKTNLCKAFLTRCVGIKDRLYGYMICRFYFFGRIYYMLHKLKDFRK